MGVLLSYNAIEVLSDRGKVAKQLTVDHHFVTQEPHKTAEESVSSAFTRKMSLLLAS
jgi:hypothetical protein